MCELREIIWYIIHANRMLLKIWPHLTFGWLFVDISLTIHPTHSKLYIFVILIISRVIWYTWKAIWSILKFRPPLDLCVTPTGKGPNRPKFWQNIFRPITTSKPSVTHFHQNAREYFFHYCLQFDLQQWPQMTPRWPPIKNSWTLRKNLRPRISSSKFHQNLSNHVDEKLFERIWIVTPRWPLDDLWPQISEHPFCPLPDGYCVQVSWKSIVLFYNITAYSWNV